MPYFPDLKSELKKARMKYSSHEYLSLSCFTSFLAFLISLPILSFLLSYKFPIFLFSFLFSITIALFLSALLFFILLKYPKFVSASRSQKIEKDLPFASLYLATISSSKLPLHKTFEMFEKFGKYDAVVSEIKRINENVRNFGLDINTAIEKGIEENPSKKMQEFLWGLLSVSRGGGDVSLFLKERSRSLFEEYRRKLYEFSHSLTVYVEIYLTGVVIGSIFFVILTSIISGISGTPLESIVPMQFFLMIFLLPAVSLLFLFLVKKSSPGED